MFGNPINDLRNERFNRAKRAGSPYFPWTPGAIAAGAVAEIEVGRQFPGARRFEPLDYIEIINNEPANQITVSINGRAAASERVITIPARTQRISDEDVFIGTIHVLNDGAVATTAGSIVIKVKKKAMTIDQAARLAV